MYFCDTDTIIEYMRACRDRKKDKLRKRIETECEKTNLCTSTINASEILFGAKKADMLNSDPDIPSKSDIAHTFLSHFIIHEYDMRAASYYSDIRVLLEGKGKPIGANDLLIASHCLSLGLPVVTGNTKEFIRIPDLTVINLKHFN